MSPPLPSLLKPALYRENVDGGCILHGGQCQRCGHVFFPMQTYGCEQCGAVAEIAAKHLEAKGNLLASALVHIHKGPGREAPFVVGAIRLNAGPVIRTLLAVSDQRDLSPGCAMTACLIETSNAEGESRRDLRFLPVKENP